MVSLSFCATSARRIAAASLTGALVLSAAPAQAQSSNPLLEPWQAPQGSSQIAPLQPTPETQSNPQDARLVDLRHIAGHLYEADVYSPSMNKIITNNLLLPGGKDNHAPRPTLYLMQGSDGGETGSTWPANTNYEAFFSDKNVNVVSPIGGRRTFYADWARDDAALGHVRWNTYFTQELPVVMARDFHDNGVHAVAGLSMSGIGALNAVTSTPDNYVAVAALSTYPSLSSGMGRFVQALVTIDGGADFRNAFGWWDDPRWNSHDPYANMDTLRGKKIYVSSGNSMPVQSDGYSFEIFQDQLAELGSRWTTDAFVNEARSRGLDIHYDREDSGVHNWRFFEQQLYKAWNTTLGPALGA